MSKQVEYEHINLIDVPYGFGWVRRNGVGLIGGSTYPISHYLEEINQEVKELKADNARMKSKIAEFIDGECGL